MIALTAEKIDPLQKEFIFSQNMVQNLQITDILITSSA